MFLSNAGNFHTCMWHILSIFTCCFSPKSSLIHPYPSQLCVFLFFFLFLKIFLDSPDADLFCSNTHGCGSVYSSMVHLQDTTHKRTLTLHPQKPSAISSFSTRSGGLGAPSLSVMEWWLVWFEVATTPMSSWVQWPCHSQKTLFCSRPPVALRLFPLLLPWWLLSPVGNEWYKCPTCERASCKHFFSALWAVVLWVTHCPLHKETSLMRFESYSNLWIER